MRHWTRFGTGLALLALLSACTSVGGRRVPAPEAVEQVSAQAAQAEESRVQAVLAQPAWSFEGRVAVSRGRDGGSGRIEWRQDGRVYEVALSAPVTRQSWRLVGNSHYEGGRLEGLAGGPRDGEDAEELLAEATGWRVPVNHLPDWMRGLVAHDALPPERLARDAEGRPRRLQQMGWDIQYLDWYPAEAGRPALPRRIEAVSGDAKVRLIVDAWRLEDGA